MAYRHTDEIPLSREVGANMRAAAEDGYLTNTNVAAADTVAGVRALMTNGHSDQKPNQHRFQRAVDVGENLADFTNALINPLTTVEGLVDLTAAADTVDRNQMIQ